MYINGSQPTCSTSHISADIFLIIDKLPAVNIQIYRNHINDNWVDYVENILLDKFQEDTDATGQSPLAIVSPGAMLQP